MLPAIMLTIAVWGWDPVPEATGYRFYWSHVATGWSACDRIEVTDPWIPYPAVPDPGPGEIIYFNVTAFNAAGESVEQHGPVLPCP